MAFIELKPSKMIPGKTRENVTIIKKIIITPTIIPTHEKNMFRIKARIIKINVIMPIIIDETIPLNPYFFEY